MLKRKPKTKLEQRVKEHKDFIAKVTNRYKGKKERMPKMTKMFLKHARQAVKNLEGKIKKAAA